MIIDEVKVFIVERQIGGSPPDIDTDFEGNRRDEVKRYIEERYGIDNVCSIGTYGTFKTKAALRDLCRISGVPPQTLNYFAAMMEESDNNYESVFKQAVQTKIFKDFIQENFDEKFKIFMELETWLRSGQIEPKDIQDLFDTIGYDSLKT